MGQEVTLSARQGHERRPDIVLYVNGIAVGVLELKNSRKAIEDGILQNLPNPQPGFHPRSFSTVQLVPAGNDSEGLRYGTTLTPARYLMAWKEDEQDNAGYKLDKFPCKLCRTRPRLLCSLVHTFGPRDRRQSDEQFERFVRELEDGPSRTTGEVFVSWMSATARRTGGCTGSRG